METINKEYTAKQYIETAEAAMRFINTRKQTAPQGIFWKLDDAAAEKPSYYDEICMYAGASGILCFLLALYKVTKKESYLEEAKEAAAYLKHRWENARTLKRNFSFYAYSTGWGGAAFALIRLYDVTNETSYKLLAEQILNQAVKDAEVLPDGGYTWSSYPGIVGDAGVILVLLDSAEKLGHADWKEFALEAGRAFLNKGRDMGEGKRYYSGVDPSYFHGGSDYIDPNFPMGTAGIGFLLLKLFEASGDEAFYKALKGVPEYMDSIAVKMKAGSLLPHALPDRPDLFYLGYCHGPAGTTRFYYALYEKTKDQRFLTAINKLVAGLESTGAPEVRSAGFWNTENICCGTAGILNMYLGLWAAFGKEHDLALAKRCGKVLMEKVEFSKTEQGETMASWRFAEDRVAPERLSTAIGYMDGAAGIGAMLLQLATAQQGGFYASRAVDDPFPAAMRA